jgi:hypothetical protein
MALKAFVSLKKEKLTKVEVMAGVASVGGNWMGERPVRQQVRALAGTSRLSESLDR